MENWHFSLMVYVYIDILVGQHLGESKTAPQYPNPDVNGDGVVNIQDIVLVGQHFGQAYSSSAPSRGIWSVDPQYLPILAKIYAIMEGEPSADPDFITTKSLIFRLMANAGIIEGFITPMNPSLPARIGIIAVTGTLFMAYFAGARTVR